MTKTKTKPDDAGDSPDFTEDEIDIADGVWDDLDDDDADHAAFSADDYAPGFPQEAHDLAASLAHDLGADLCDPDDDGEHVDPDRMDELAVLRIFHDIACHHGAECPGDDADGMDGEGDSSGEVPAIHFDDGGVDSPGWGDEPPVRTPPVSFS